MTFTAMDPLPPADQPELADGVDPVATFAAERPRLLGLAYRALGSYSDAEDVVQEAWLRAQRTDLATLDNPAAWLTTVVSRLAVDRMRTLARRREAYVGPWLPEPIALAEGGGGGIDPGDAAATADSLTLGFLVVLDRLNPVERIVFLLADVFGEPFAAIAAYVGRSEAACRQIASRARRRVRERAAPGDEQRPSRRPADRALLERLLLALASGDASRVVALLEPDAVLVSDGGPQRHAARRPVLGADRIARLLTFIAKRVTPGAELVWRRVNGEDALVVLVHGRPDLVMVADTGRRAGTLGAIHLVLNPDKLGHLDAPVALT